MAMNLAVYGDSIAEQVGTAGNIESKDATTRIGGGLVCDSLRDVSHIPQNVDGTIVSIGFNEAQYLDHGIRPAKYQEMVENKLQQTIDRTGIKI